MSEISRFHFHSAGIVAANKELSSKIIEVVPIEEYPMFDGELSNEKIEYKTDSKDSQGSAYQISLDTAPSISAKWLPFGASNRLTAPDVRRGEMVMIYRFGDSDKYYWQTLKDDNKLRKLETVIYGWSATKNEDDDVGPDTMYYAEVSTHRKLIHIHTSRANGEPFAYDIQINTDQGFIKIQDDDGQFIVLDSKERQIICQNKDESKIDILKREIFIKAPDLIQLDAENITFNSTNQKVSTTNLTKNSTKETNTTTTLEETTTSYKLRTSTTTVYGDITFKNPVTLNNGISVTAGASSFSGGGTVTGNLGVTGNISSTGNLNTVNYPTNGLSATLGTANQQAASAINSLASSTSGQIGQLQSQITGLNNAVNNLSSTESSLVNQMNNVQTTLSNLQNQITQLQTQINNMTPPP